MIILHKEMPMTKELVPTFSYTLPVPKDGRGDGFGMSRPSKVFYHPRTGARPPSIEPLHAVQAGWLIEYLLVLWDSIYRLNKLLSPNTCSAR